MKDKEQKLYKRFVLLFWTNIVIVIFLFLFLLQIKGPDFGKDIQADVAFERWAIIITLAAIPGALKLFQNITKKQDEQNELRRYQLAYSLRMLILDLAFVFNLIGFHLFESTNFIYMCIVTIFAMCFCYPAKKHSDKKDCPKNEENTESDITNNEQT